MAELPADWSTEALADCTLDGNISYGIVQPGRPDPDGIPMLRVNNIRNGSLDLAEVLRVAHEIEDGYKRTRLTGGEVLLTLVGSTGQSLVVPQELAGWNVARAIAVIKPKPGVSADWINICLKTGAAQHFLDVRSNTTVQNTLNLKDVKEIPIIFPPDDVRQEIESIAIALDDKIELNRRMNRTLEAMAQAIFKSWFVDFEPVRAEAVAKAFGASPAAIERAAMAAIAGRSIEEAIAQEGYFDDLTPSNRASLAQTAALFPDALQDSELGEIPEGWKTSAVGDQCKIARGASPRPIKNFMNGSVPWVKIADATASDSVFIFQTKEFVTQEGAERSVRLVPGSLILSNSATSGIPMFLEVDGCIHDGWLYFTDFAEVQKNYLYFALARLTAKLVQIADGSVQKNLNTSLVSRERFVVPSAEVHRAFDRFSATTFASIRSNCLQSRTLAQLRDTLLPKLLSGELTVPEAESKTEEALT